MCILTNRNSFKKSGLLLFVDFGQVSSEMA